MKRLIYQVCLGKKSRLYEHCINSVKEYCKIYNIDHFVQTIPKLRIKPDIFSTNRSVESYEKHGGFLPIYEKENAFSYFPTYDQIAIIDADVWIRPNSPNVFDSLSSTYDAGFVCEREMPITETYRKKIINYSQMQYLVLRDVDWKWDKSNCGEFFNMGIMILNKSIHKYLKGQTPHQFLMRNVFKGFIDGQGAWKWSTDQTLLNWWIKKEKMSIKHLNWKWNGLFHGIQDDKAKQAHFVHFFLKDKLPNRGENVEELMKHVNN
tara:strand:- start:6905 stop:7696 length:792 start_codon:yes stop_codon:yes gene_type:complete